MLRIEKVRVPTGRDGAVDAVRGFAILSMFYTHVAAGTVGEKLTHPNPWVDGAIGFVLLSGFVIGQVQRRSAHVHRIRRCTRRVVLLYLTQISLVFGTFILYAGVHRDTIFHVGQHGGWAHVIPETLELRALPGFIDILPMYILFMIAAVPVILLLERNRWQVVVLASITIWVLCQVMPHGLAFNKPSYADPIYGDGYSFRPAAWQLVFFGGLLVGWYKNDLAAKLGFDGVRRISTAAIVIAAGFLAAAMMLKASHHIGYHGSWVNRAETSADDSGVMSKDYVGPLALLAGVSTFVALIRIVTQIGTRGILWQRVRGALERVGRRSLACYVGITIMAVGVPLLDLSAHELEIAALPLLALLYISAGWRIRSGAPSRRSSATQRRIRPAPEVPSASL